MNKRLRLSLAILLTLAIVGGVLAVLPQAVQAAPAPSGLSNMPDNAVCGGAYTGCTTSGILDNDNTTAGTLTKNGSCTSSGCTATISFWFPNGGTPSSVHLKYSTTGTNAFAIYALCAYGDSTNCSTLHSANNPSGTVDTTYTVPSTTRGIRFDCDYHATSCVINIYYADLIYSATATPTGTATFTPTITNTATATSTGTITATATPTVGPLQGGATGLQNGNFEFPAIDPWLAETGQLISAPSGYQPVTGPAACGLSYYFVKPNLHQSDTTYVIQGQVTHAWLENPAISQRFYWPGGVAYFHSQVKATSFAGLQVGVRLVQVTTGYDVPAGMEIFVRDGQGILNSPDWQTLTQASSGSLPAGFYDLEISSGYGLHDPPIYTSEQPDLANNPKYQFYIDDITVSPNAYTSGCVNGATLTPSATRTASPTRTQTPTGTTGFTSTPTATNGPAGAWANCAFEAGSNGWVGTNWSVQLAGGPIGARYAQVSSGGVLRQYFSWIGGGGYFTFWVGPGSYGNVRIRNLYTGAINTIYTSAGPATWQLIKTSLPYIPGGQYAFEVTPNVGALFKIDGVMVSVGNYQYCGATISGTAVTPTSGPTSYVTATASNTLAATFTATLTLTPTRTLVPSTTPIPGVYQQLTAAAALNGTNSAILTQQSNSQSTAVANVTSTANATAYAQATQLASLNLTLQAIATQQATQANGGGGGGGGFATQVPTPQPQPPLGSQDCSRPDNALNVPAWLDYENCQITGFFAWNDGNTQRITDFIDLANQHEPYATITGFAEMLKELSGVFASIDWNASVSCDGNAFQLLQPAGPILQGQLILTPEDPISTSCELPFAQVLGDTLNAGLCWVYNLLCAKGILQLMRWTINVAFIFGFVAYIWANWVSKAND